MGEKTVVTRRAAFRRSGALLGGVCAGAVVAACGQSAGGTPAERKAVGPASITFMNRGDAAAFAVHERAVAAFMKDVPEIKVTLEPVVSGTWIERLTTQLAGATAPDAVMCAYGDFLQFCKRGDFVNLDTYLSKDRDVKVADWFPLALESMKYKGKIFNMPYNGGTLALFYSKDIFDKNKTRYPDDTWTWDTYVDVGTRVTTDAKGVHANEAGFDGNNVALYGASNLQNDPDWLYWLWVNGTDLYTNNNKEVNLKDPKALDAIQWIADMHKKRIWPSVLVKDANPTGFRNGNVATAAWGHWQVARVRTDPFKWDVAPLPKTKDGKRIALGWYSGNGMVRTTKSPEAAWEFLKWFGGAPGQRLLGIEGLTLPAVRKVAESDEIMKSVPPDNQRAFLTEIDRARVRYNWNITEQRDWNEIINPELNKIWAGEAKAKDVLPPIVPRLNEVLSRN